MTSHFTTSTILALAVTFASLPSHSNKLVSAAATPAKYSKNVVRAWNATEGVKPSLEWTALGDSYASGVGTSDYVDGRRCLRYDEAYPKLMNLDPMWSPGGDAVFPPGLHQLNNVVCSGAESEDIIKYQLLDKPAYDKPNPSFGNRPAFGNPEFATLTAGGDDIDFPGILFNCILGAHVTGGPTKRTCTDQRSYTWGLLNDGRYITDLGKVIDAIVQKGRKGPVGDDFRLYVTGYGRFFNAETTGSDTNCDDTTFQINGLFFDGTPLGVKGAKDAFLTQDLRRDFNNMADALNEGIEKAVADYNDDHVKFVDIQTDPKGRDVLAGHRFCEKGVQEPDRSNPNLFFWHFPYKGQSDPKTSNATAGASNNATEASAENEQAFNECFQDAYNQTWFDAGDDINAVYPKYNQFFNAVLDKLTVDMLRDYNIGDFEDAAFWGDTVGKRTRVFHPQFNWHEAITTLILTQYVLDHGENPVPNPNNYTVRQCSVEVKQFTAGFSKIAQGNDTVYREGSWLFLATFTDIDGVVSDQVEKLIAPGATASIADVLPLPFEISAGIDGTGDSDPVGFQYAGWSGVAATGQLVPCAVDGYDDLERKILCVFPCT